MKKAIIILIMIILVGIGVYFISQESAQDTEIPVTQIVPDNHVENTTPSPIPPPVSEITPPPAPAPSPTNPPAPAPPPPAPVPVPVAVPPAPISKTFNITGHNFAFSQSEIRVNLGTQVTIDFESIEGFHDLTVEGYGVGTKSVLPGTKTTVSFTADKTGTFIFYCSVGNHRAQGMVGSLIVE